MLLVLTALFTSGANGAAGETDAGGRGCGFDSTMGYPGEGPAGHDGETAPANVRTRRRLRGKQRPPGEEDEPQQALPAIADLAEASTWRQASRCRVNPPTAGPCDDPVCPEGGVQRKISIFESLTNTWRQRGRARASGREAKSGIEVYYANVSSWSPKAREYFEQEVRADALAVVETHLHGREYTHWKNRIRKWGYKVSGREADVPQREGHQWRLLGGGGQRHDVVRHGAAG